MIRSTAIRWLDRTAGAATGAAICACLALAAAPPHSIERTGRDVPTGRVSLRPPEAAALTLPPVVGAAAPRPHSGASPVQRSMRVTAYCPCPLCCGDHADGVTASGAPALGRLIAAPREIPFGTLIDVPGYGIAPVLDRGGAISGDRLDVLFPMHAEARAWGVRRLDVTILGAESAPARRGGEIAEEFP